MSKSSILLQAPWNAPSNVKTLITTVGLNLAKHIDVNLEQVEENRKTILNHVPSQPLYLSQQHTTNVISSSEYTKDIIADAIYTNESKKVLPIMTADCLPIMLTNGKWVANIHAGWKGLCYNIIERTLDKLDKSLPIYAFIGPAICESCFEIGDEVREEFIKSDNNLSQFFSKKNKYHGNLRAIAEYKLIHRGVANITNPDICTACNTSMFYSHRKSQQQGRITSFIWLE